MVDSPFQARFTGPHTIVKQVSDENYLISTPERRRKTQLCHINLLKPYYNRVVEPDVSSVLGSGYVQSVAVANKAVTFPSQSVAVTEGEESHIVAHLTVNLAKCDFACATVTYLGHVVGQGQVWPVQAKVLAEGQILFQQQRKNLRGSLGW